MDNDCGVFIALRPYCIRFRNFILNFFKFYSYLFFCIALCELTCTSLRTLTHRLAFRNDTLCLSHAFSSPCSPLSTSLWLLHELGMVPLTVARIRLTRRAKTRASSTPVVSLPAGERFTPPSTRGTGKPLVDPGMANLELAESA
jgi:hypothetical protein